MKNNDVRTEGMGYGLMVMLQLGDQPRFDRIWAWVKTYMYHGDWNDPLYGWSAWHCYHNGTVIDQGPAPDGETCEGGRSVEAVRVISPTRVLPLRRVCHIAALRGEAVGRRERPLQLHGRGGHHPDVCELQARTCKHVRQGDPRRPFRPRVRFHGPVVLPARFLPNLGPALQLLRCRLER